MAMAQGGRRMRRFVEGVYDLLTNTTLAQDISAIYHWPEEQLAALETPTLIILGNDSPCVSGGRRLGELMPNAQVVELDGGHFLTAERPTELTIAMELFLG